MPGRAGVTYHAWVWCFRGREPGDGLGGGQAMRPTGLAIVGNGHGCRALVLFLGLIWALGPTKRTTKNKTKNENNDTIK